MKIELIKPCGYCNGVKKTLDIVNNVRVSNPNKNIYIFGSIIHNEHINKYLDNLNIKSLEISKHSLDNLNKDDIVIFSAHGHSKEYENILNLMGIEYYDTTCFNVSKNMNLINYYHYKLPIIFIGKKNHEETNTALSYSNVYLYNIKDKIDYSLLDLNKEYLIVNQTSISIYDYNKSINDIKKHINNLIINDGLCGLIKQRIENVKSINKESTIILVIGSKSSSNTKSLYEECIRLYPSKKVYLINDINDINFNINNNDYISILSGCSSDIESINDIVEYLNNI